MLFWLHGVIGMEPEFDWHQIMARAPWEFVLIYAVLMVVRNRWVNRVLLTGALAYYAWTVVGIPLVE